MSEIVPTYLLRDPEEVIPMDRADFYAEQIKEFQENGKPTRAVEIIQILLFTPEGEIILQKRSPRKKHNPGLVDKTIGGHVQFGNSALYTAMYETLQELEVPSIVLPDFDEFHKAYRLLRDYLKTTSLIYNVDSRIVPSKKLFSEGEIVISNKYNLYFGVYGGSIRPADREASGILFSKLEDLKADMEKAPDMYTHDLRFFLDKYEAKISKFLDFLTSTT